MSRARGPGSGPAPDPRAAGSGTPASGDGFHRAWNAAAAALKRGDLKPARNHLRKALEHDPGHAAALHHLGLVCQRLGRLDEAAQWLARAVTADPSDAVTRNNLGNVLAAAGRGEDALAAYREAVAVRPDYVNARFNLARTLERSGRLEEAIAAYRELVRLAPRDLEALNGLGVALMDAGRHQEAAQTFRSALAVDPAHGESHNNLGVVLMYAGDMEAAQESFRTAVGHWPGYARAYENLARSRRFGPGDEAMVEKLEALIERNGASGEDRMLYHFALGKILDDLGEPERAFGHFSRGNAIRRAASGFDRRAHRAWVDRVIDTFNPKLLARAPDIGSDSERPVFIVGMIRSGTTLVEQILAAHPAAAGAGELLYLTGMAQDLPRHLKSVADFPECARELDRPRALRLANRYLELLGGVDACAVRVSDKLPTNFLVLGLIALLFPRARVIHCSRDPRDVGLSIYFQRFARGHDYAYDLDDIAAYYREYTRLMAHWKQVLPLPIHEVRYESVVAEQERESRSLIEFLGLDWDPACLDFDKARRVVSTASHWQVRQPVYRSSVARWRRYQRFLGPLSGLVPGAVESSS